MKNWKEAHNACLRFISCYTEGIDKEYRLIPKSTLYELKEMLNHLGVENNNLKNEVALLKNGKMEEQSISKKDVASLLYLGSLFGLTEEDAKKIYELFNS